ncbi:MAG: cbb3-type cytochrome c oxidase subunit I [Deltaproteobacteria bacterium]|nr:cbb3-type cytochrome c oxidase subunit I [Deltaproteobacteria bacterium]
MHDHAPSSFLRRYVFSTDHKVIGLQYMFTGLAMALLGGFLAYVMRSQLAHPGTPVAGFGTVSNAEYNAIVTLHGTIMVFWVAMPVLVAGFGNYLIPLLIGTDDMAFPKLNLMSFWTFFLSTVVLILSMFVPGGASGSGWTTYPPLSAKPAFTGVGLGLDLWIVAVALEFVAFLMGGVNFITTAINRRAKGMGLWDLPLFVWEEVIASIIFMLSVGPLVAGALMLLADRNLNTGFFDAAAGGDPLLFQHLFWFFGHPEVYVLLLPALGILAEVLTVCARKAIFGYRLIVWSTIVAGLLSFIVWAHHQFISGIDPRLASPFSLTTILISVPFAITLFCYMATLYQGSIRYTVAMLFAMAMLAEFLLGGVTGIINGSAAADIYVHDSYFVVAHFHYTLFPIVFLAPFAGFYHWYPKFFGRHLNHGLGLLHFYGTIVFFNLCFLPMFALGMMGHQRRIADPNAFGYLAHGQHYQQLATWGAIGLLVLQIPFIVNIFLSLRKGAPAEANPWRGTTLDWAVPSPPPHGNFEAPPVCYRGPYVYGVPGAADDFVPQHMPPGPGAPTARVPDGDAAQLAAAGSPVA